MNSSPPLVSILRQGPYLVASIHTALDDEQLRRFRRDLIARIGSDRARGVIIDVAALDVLDSYGSRTLKHIAEMARLRGALTVVVGIQPDVAYTMVELGMGMSLPHTALDLEEGLAYLDRCVPTHALRRQASAIPRAVPDVESLRRDYRAAFLRYLPRADEGALAEAYEVGRSAVTAGVSVLELSSIHHDVLIEVLRDVRDAAEMERVARAASVLLSEVLVTSEMAQRRWVEDRER